MYSKAVPFILKNGSHAICQQKGATARLVKRFSTLSVTNNLTVYFCSFVLQSASNSHL